MVTLFKTQFMLVRGQQYISRYVAGLPTSTEAAMTDKDKEYPALELDIVIQINGGLKSMTKYFSLGWVEGEFGQVGITLTDWKAWREFYDTLADMGYYFSSEKNVEAVEGYSIIKKWIREVYPEYQYNEDFNGIAKKPE